MNIHSAPRFRRLLFALTVPFLFSSTTALEAEAQLWRQRAQLITTVDYEQSTDAFLRTLVEVYEQHPKALVQRYPGDTEPVTFSELEKDLYELGLDPTSATHLFVDYDFQSGGGQLSETLRGFAFIYREATGDAEDIPILYVTAQDSLVRHVLWHHGVANPENLGDVTIFRDVLSFPHLTRDQPTQMVSLANRPLREGFDERRDALFAVLTALIYDEGHTFAMSVE